MLKPIPYYRDEHGNTVKFCPVANLPGFTHRVIVNNAPVGWLADTHKPSVKTTTYFLNKILEDK